MFIEIDARGLACPKPVINTKKELEKIDQGIVIVTVDNDMAKQNIMKLTKSLNCQSRILKEEQDLISIEIMKGENDIIKERQEKSELEDKCIFISSDKMGKGSDELGDILIKGFVYTLTERKPYPKNIVLVNSGIKLSTENEAVIEHLKVLEQGGTQILSCGTCLDYYGVKEKLQVGTITNMYSIVDITQNSSQTISI